MSRYVIFLINEKLGAGIAEWLFATILWLGFLNKKISKFWIREPATLKCLDGTEIIISSIFFELRSLSVKIQKKTYSFFGHDFDSTDVSRRLTAVKLTPVTIAALPVCIAAVVGS